jgi:hypothetical protein
VPEFVTVKPSWKPPDQEFVNDQLTEQPAPAVLVDEGLGLGVTLGLGLGDELGLGEELGLGLADWLVLGLGVGDGCPLPLDSTTIDSAGTLTDVPEKLLLATVGFAAEYVYSVSAVLVMPRLEVEIVYALDGSALTSITE